MQPAPAPSLSVLPPPPKPGGLARASHPVHQLLAAAKPPPEWNNSDMDEYVYGTVTKVTEAFEKRVGKKAKTITLQLIEGTEAGESIPPSSTRTVMLGYAQLEPLASQVAVGQKVVLHYQGRKGFAHQFRFAVEESRAAAAEF